MQRLYPCLFPHTPHLWPRKETVRSRGSEQTLLRPSLSPVLGICRASAYLQPFPTTRPPLGRSVHLLAAVRGLGGCTKASAGHAPVCARALLSLPRMGQRYSQGFGCGHLPAPSTLWCASAALLCSTKGKPIKVAQTYGHVNQLIGIFALIDIRFW